MPQTQTLDDCSWSCYTAYRDVGIVLKRESIDTEEALSDSEV
jgi:hypothetical protein